jgi:DNA-damage-inducible protein J
MNTVIQARIDTASKKEAEAILNQMGMSLNDGIRVFIRQVIHQRALPFRPSLPEIPNEETCKAMQRADDYISGKNRDGFRTFETVDEAMADLLSEED